MTALKDAQEDNKSPLLWVSKLTKIVSTLGPASDTPEKIRHLIKSGVNVFRFNMKHNETSWHLERINRVQSAADELGVRVGIMIDLQGPEIRIKTPEGKEIPLQKDEEVLCVTSKRDLSKRVNSIVGPSVDEGHEKYILISQEPVIESLEEGDEFSVDDGFYSFRVSEKISDRVLKARIQNSGVIKTNKSLNLVGKDLALPSLIEADLDKLDIAAKTKVDFIALSFVRSKEDVITLREEMDKRKIAARVVSKIESQKGLDNIDEIIQNSDVVMIARGDLGIETPLEKVPYLQKLIINKCREASKPVIVATQMLQSMIENPIPTRAEAADVAGAVYDGADALMLSGETAVGGYPVESVEYMSKIAFFNESHSQADKEYIPQALDQTHAVVRAALTMLAPFSGVKVDKLIVGTQSGYTARVFSAYRPKVPILALSGNPKTVEELTLSYGVLPIFMKLQEQEFTNPDSLIKRLKKGNYLSTGETVLLVHGKRVKDPGNTNSITVLTVP